MNRIPRLYLVVIAIVLVAAVATAVYLRRRAIETEKAVAACDTRGRWYRTYAKYGAGLGATYNRFEKVGDVLITAGTSGVMRYERR